MKFEWEPIDNWNGRLKVTSGWILERLSSHKKYWLSFIPVTYANNSVVFIPDPNHEWEIEK